MSVGQAGIDGSYMWLSASLPSQDLWLGYGLAVALGEARIARPVVSRRLHLPGGAGVSRAGGHR